MIQCDVCGVKATAPTVASCLVRENGGRAIMIDRRHSGGMKRIKTYYCGFCRKVVKEPNKVHVGGKRWWYLCPTCGGYLLGDSPGISREIYKG